MESKTQKILLIASGATLALAIGIGAFWMTRGKSDIHETLQSDTGVFRIENADSANLKITSGPVDSVTVDIENPNGQKVRFFGGGGEDSGFELPEDWGDASGTVIVPTGTLVALVTSKNPGIPNQKGDSVTMVVDTSKHKEIITGPGGVQIPSNGEGGDLLHGSPEDDGENGEGGTGGGPANCGFGPQTLRDRCCVRKNVGTRTLECLGNWIYDNTTKSCIYECALEGETYFGDEKKDGGGNGGQNGGGGSSGGGSNGGSTNPPQDPTTRFCSAYPPADRSTCCDEQLRNPLRIGPRPGFPDCIGRWYYDASLQGCKFRCSDYGEMLDILSEIKNEPPSD